jgi:hypothetical protein
MNPHCRIAADGYFFHSPQLRLPAPSRFLILGLVNLMRLLSATKTEIPGGRILQLTTRFRYRGCATLLILCFAGTARQMSRRRGTAICSCAPGRLPPRASGPSSNN